MQFAPLSSSANGSANRRAVTFGACVFEVRGLWRSAAAVSAGDRVGRGAVIGTLQAFGSHCAPRSCLHWGWLRGETYLDPLRLVGAGPIRLLPLWRDDPVAARSSAPGRVPLPFDGWRPSLW